MDKKKLSWYMVRASKMSLKEMFWRFDRLVNQPDLRKDKAIPLDLAVKEMRAEVAALGLAGRRASRAEAERVIERAEAVMRRELEFFGEKVQLPEPFSWLADPVSKVRSPRKDFMDINYRDFGDKLSIMRVWWLNRHYHLVDLAKAYAVTEDERYAKKLTDELESWFRECAYPYGLPWTTSMEAAMRLTVWCVVYRLMKAKLPACFTEAFALSFFRVVRQHYEHVKFNRSRYSSANNHALAELTALLCAQKTFPNLFVNEEESWAEELGKEADKQFSDKGVNLEMALSYHAFSLELLCAAAACDPEFLEKIRPLLNSAALYLERARTTAETCGEYGDSDEAVATGLIPRDEKYYANVVKLAMALSLPEANDAEEIGEPFQWYVCKSAPPVLTEDRIHYSKDVGMFWRGKVGEGLLVDLFFVTGPLGFGKLAAHGHADALSFVMSVNGTPVFIESGTGAYHQNRKWRKYFRSTAAHNTLEAEGESQSQDLAPFVWRENFRVEIESDDMTEEGFNLSARHYGYKKRFSLTHRRTLKLEGPSSYLEILDETLGCDSVRARQFFHVSPLCSVAQTGNKTFIIKGPGFEITMDLFDVHTARFLIGDETKPLGFYSKHLGKWEPCGVIETEANCLGQDVLRTALKFKKI